MKRHHYMRPTAGFIAIHMPKNTGAGFVIAALSAMLGFSLIWRMWIPAGAAFLALICAVIVHTFNYDRVHHVSAVEVDKVEGIRTLQLAAHV